MVPGLERKGCPSFSTPFRTVSFLLLVAAPGPPASAGPGILSLVWRRRGAAPDGVHVSGQSPNARARPLSRISRLLHSLSSFFSPLFSSTSNPHSFPFFFSSRAPFRAATFQRVTPERDLDIDCPPRSLLPLPVPEPAPFWRASPRRPAN